MQAIHQFTSILEEQGYLEEGTSIKGISFFYKEEQESLHGILCVDLDYNTKITVIGLKSVRAELASRHSVFVPGIGNALAPFVMNPEQMLTVIFSAKQDWAHKLSRMETHFWLVDTKYHTLMIFDNQPSDFFGIKETLEEALDIAREEDRAYLSNPIKRMLYRRNGAQRAYINTLIVVVNIIVFFCAELAGDTTDAEYLFACGGALPYAIVEFGETWRLFTATFLHAGIGHLFDNMLLLWVLGDNVERELGHIRYGILYLIAGLGASLTSLLFQLIDGTNYVGVGASGAIFGMLGGLIYLLYKHKGFLEGLTFKRMVVMVALILYNGFTSTGVDNAAHVGGLITGFVMAMILVNIKELRLRKKMRRESNSYEN